ncbi:uncharacterized protein V6R79_019129 [Siganus canaliculatus]
MQSPDQEPSISTTHYPPTGASQPIIEEEEEQQGSSAASQRRGVELMCNMGQQWRKQQAVSEKNSIRQSEGTELKQQSAASLRQLCESMPLSSGNKFTINLWPDERHHEVIMEFKGRLATANAAIKLEPINSGLLLQPLKHMTLTAAALVHVVSGEDERCRRSSGTMKRRFIFTQLPHSLDGCYGNTCGCSTVPIK